MPVLQEPSDRRSGLAFLIPSCPPVFPPFAQCPALGASRWVQAVRGGLRPQGLGGRRGRGGRHSFALCGWLSTCTREGGVSYRTLDLFRYFKKKTPCFKNVFYVLCITSFHEEQTQDSLVPTESKSKRYGKPSFTDPSDQGGDGAAPGPARLPGSEPRAREEPPLAGPSAGPTLGAGVRQ